MKIEKIIQKDSQLEVFVEGGTFELKHHIERDKEKKFEIFKFCTHTLLDKIKSIKCKKINLEIVDKNHIKVCFCISNCPKNVKVRTVEIRTYQYVLAF